MSVGTWLYLGNCLALLKKNTNVRMFYLVSERGYCLVFGTNFYKHFCLAI